MLAVLTLFSCFTETGQEALLLRFVRNDLFLEFYVFKFVYFLRRWESAESVIAKRRPWRETRSPGI